jgi:3',5'-cyclic AMP phosphodiesterase CpdA
LESRIRVVCIADTHNHQPELPPGDLLIHAGDLTENGSFDEIQNQPTWLSSQPHQYKVAIAGNHDVLLDEEFLKKYPERRYGQTKTLYDLNWGTVQFLQHSSITLNFTFDDSAAGEGSRTRP